MNEKQHFPHFPATHASGGQRGEPVNTDLEGPKQCPGGPGGLPRKAAFQQTLRDWQGRAWKDMFEGQVMGAMGAGLSA